MRAGLLKNGHIGVIDCFEVKDKLKSIPGTSYEGLKKMWIMPLTIEAIELLRDLMCSLDKSLITEYNRLIRNRSQTEELRLAEHVEPIEPIPIKANIKPFQHQIKAYNLGLINDYFAYLMEMGTGKSLAAVMVAARRYERGEVHKLLIAAPTSVLPVWEKEFKAVTIPNEVHILEGSMNKRIMALYNFRTKGLQVAVINYEATWRMIDTLIQWQPDMIICDESQRIKTHNAEQSKAMHKLGKIAKYKLILSGTPVQNAPLDFFSQYKFLDETIFGTSYYAFRARYARMGGYGNHQVIGYNNLPELIKKAHSVALRVTKEEALDLPEQTFETRYCSLEPKAQKIYDEIRAESFAELEREGSVTVRNVLTKLLRLQQITGGYINSDEGILQHISTSKLNLLQEIIEDTIESGKKVVIFARFTAEIDAIKKVMEKLNIKYSWISGEVMIENRGEQVRIFQEDPEIKVFIAQIQTAGLGITLTAADTAIYYSMDFNYANYSQSLARIHRIGQKNNCTYIHLIAHDTVDEKIIEALGKKEDMAKLVVDNWRQYFKK